MDSSSHDNMSFLEHLEELRWHIIRSLIAIVSAGFICFLMKDFIFDTIIFGPKKWTFPHISFCVKLQHSLELKLLSAETNFHS